MVSGGHFGPFLGVRLHTFRGVRLANVSGVRWHTCRFAVKDIETLRFSVFGRHRGVLFGWILVLPFPANLRHLF